MRNKSPLLNLLTGDIFVEQLNDEEISLLLAEARACGLLTRIAFALARTHGSNSPSSHLADQLSAATIFFGGFKQDVLRELSHIEHALSNLKVPVILLKGASYILLDLPPADGRIFSDIDILVPKSHIAAAEAALMLGGWSTGKLDAYDQRYYRQWSHEIPPMTHLQRGTTIDLHHSLVMPSCRVRVDSAKMISDAVQVSGGGFWWRLKDEDMLLHAASHLLLNSEFDRGLRDLWDIDLLYRYFSAGSGDFPDRLLTRAQNVGLVHILTLALSLASTNFGTPLPEFMRAEKSNFLVRLLSRAATTRHPETKPKGQTAADIALMLREMYLRLPNKLLAVHLVHKLTDLCSAPKKKETA